MTKEELRKGVTMFEEEAEKYVPNINWHAYSSKEIREEMMVCYQKGAELGYNKANEWHYPSKGEYPKECENVLCYCKMVGVKFYSIGHTVISGDNKIRWWSNDRSEKLKVYAWKEITLPKEIEEK